jgi:hypothetical protein
MTPPGSTHSRGSRIASATWWCERVAGITAALDALSCMPIDAEPAARAVVSDDGEAIRLTLYGEGGSVAAVELDLVRAVALAGRLLKAAAPRLRWT